MMFDFRFGDGMRRLFSAWIAVAVALWSWPVQAYEGAAPSVVLSPASTALRVVGLNVHEDDPLRFDFLVDRDLRDSERAAFRDFANIFLTLLTVPSRDIWVNLSPIESDRVLPGSLEKTSLGRVLLEHDLSLKRLASALTRPDTQLGRTFWEKVYERAYRDFGITELPSDGFYKVWIVPAKAEVAEDGSFAVIRNASLRVLTEQDYAVLRGMTSNAAGREGEAYNNMIVDVYRTTIIPELNALLESDENFVGLRRIYDLAVLAQWYKQRVMGSWMRQQYVDRDKTAGAESFLTNISGVFYQQYTRMFKGGEYDVIREEYDPETGSVTPRHYISGGLRVVPGSVSVSVGNRAMLLPLRAVRVDFQPVDLAQLNWKSAVMVAVFVLLAGSFGSEGLKTGGDFMTPVSTEMSVAAVNQLDAFRPSLSENASGETILSVNRGNETSSATDSIAAFQGNQKLLKQIPNILTVDQVNGFINGLQISPEQKQDFKSRITVGWNQLFQGETIGDLEELMFGALESVASANGVYQGPLTFDYGPRLEKAAFDLLQMKTDGKEIVGAKAGGASAVGSDVSVRAGVSAAKQQTISADQIWSQSVQGHDQDSVQADGQGRVTEIAGTDSVVVESNVGSALQISNDSTAMAVQPVSPDSTNAGSPPPPPENLFAGLSAAAPAINFAPYLLPQAGQVSLLDLRRKREAEFQTDFALHTYYSGASAFQVSPMLSWQADLPLTPRLSSIGGYHFMLNDPRMEGDYMLNGYLGLRWEWIENSTFGSLLSDVEFMNLRDPLTSVRYTSPLRRLGSLQYRVDLGTQWFLPNENFYFNAYMPMRLPITDNLMVEFHPRLTIDLRHFFGGVDPSSWWGLRGGLSVRGHKFFLNISPRFRGQRVDAPADVTPEDLVMMEQELMMAQMRALNRSGWDMPMSPMGLEYSSPDIRINPDVNLSFHGWMGLGKDPRYNVGVFFRLGEVSRGHHATTLNFNSEGTVISDVVAANGRILNQLRGFMDTTSVHDVLLADGGVDLEEGFGDLVSTYNHPEIFDPANSLLVAAAKLKFNRILTFLFEYKNYHSFAITWNEGDLDVTTNPQSWDDQTARALVWATDHRTQINGALNEIQTGLRQAAEVQNGDSPTLGFNRAMMSSLKRRDFVVTLSAFFVLSPLKPLARIASKPVPGGFGGWTLPDHRPVLKLYLTPEHFAWHYMKNNGPQMYPIYLDYARVNYDNLFNGKLIQLVDLDIIGYSYVKEFYAYLLKLGVPANLLWDNDMFFGATNHNEMEIAFKKVLFRIVLLAEALQKQGVKPGAWKSVTGAQISAELKKISVGDDFSFPGNKIPDVGGLLQAMIPAPKPLAVTPAAAADPEIEALQSRNIITPELIYAYNQKRESNCKSSGWWNQFFYVGVGKSLNNIANDNTKESESIPISFGVGILKRTIRRYANDHFTYATQQELMKLVQERLDKKSGMLNNSYWSTDEHFSKGKDLVERWKTVKIYSQDDSGLKNPSNQVLKAAPLSTEFKSLVKETLGWIDADKAMMAVAAQAISQGQPNKYGGIDLNTEGVLSVSDSRKHTVGVSARALEIGPIQGLRVERVIPLGAASGLSNM